MMVIMIRLDSKGTAISLSLIEMKFGTDKGKNLDVRRRGINARYETDLANKLLYWINLLCCYFQIPQAYLYEENVFDISWRDPFVPKFEQFLRTHSRKVTANVVLYDLFGFDVVMNISNLDAGCFNTA